MQDRELLALRFEQERPRLRGAAYRMLGSAAEAEDAVQEAWLRLERTDPTSVENLQAWLTTVVARVCLNMLRARNSRGERPLDVPVTPAADTDVEQETLLSDSVGLALLVVLDTLAPRERLAFVLHDMFDLPFDEIAPIVDRSTAATRQVASRARRRIHGSQLPEGDRARQRRVVEAYLAATRNGDFDTLLRVLDPDVVLRADAHVGPAGESILLRGSREVAEGAVASATRARHTKVAMINDSLGLVMLLRGRVHVALVLTTSDERVTSIELIGDPARLRELPITVLSA